MLGYSFEVVLLTHPTLVVVGAVFWIQINLVCAMVYPFRERFDFIFHAAAHKVALARSDVVPAPEERPLVNLGIVPSRVWEFIWFRHT